MATNLGQFGGGGALRDFEFNHARSQRVGLCTHRAQCGLVLLLQLLHVLLVLLLRNRCRCIVADRSGGW